MRLAGALLAVMVSGCATYWIQTHAPVPVLAVIEVDHPCRHDWLGCANYGQGVLEIKRGLSAEQRECVIAHELKHFAGWSHDIRWVNGKVDCG